MVNGIWKAEYNGHTIEIVNTLFKATLKIDGVVQAISKEFITGLFMAKLPEGEDIIAVLESKFIEFESHLLIGNRVELQTVDRGNWKAEYNGHTIKIKNGLTKAIIEIDGVETDKTRSIIDGILKGKLPEGEDVMAFLDSEALGVGAYLIVGNEVKMTKEKS
ncbi:MAG: hypothetical protein IJN43_05485 [Ruminococcus sp.]|nr:hypothetical protein [Ruminococcus sp.]